MSMVKKHGTAQDVDPFTAKWSHMIEINRAVEYIDSIVQEVCRVSSGDKKLAYVSSSLADFKKWVSSFKSNVRYPIECFKNNNMVKIGMYGTEGEIDIEKNDAVTEKNITYCVEFAEGVLVGLFYSKNIICEDFKYNIDDPSRISILGSTKAAGKYAVYKVKSEQGGARNIFNGIAYEDINASALLDTCNVGAKGFVISTSVSLARFYTSQIPIGFIYDTIKLLVADNHMNVIDARRLLQILTYAYLSIFINSCDFINSLNVEFGVLDSLHAHLWKINTTTGAIIHLGKTKPGSLEENEKIMNIYDVLTHEKNRLQPYLCDIYNEFRSNSNNMIANLPGGVGDTLSKALGELPNIPGLQSVQTAVESLIGSTRGS